VLNYRKIIAFLWLACFLAGFVAPSYAEDPPLPTPIGRVVWVKGNLKALMPNNEVRELKKTSVIYLKDTLVTAKNSQAQVVFTDNTLMTFREGTKFFLDQYSYNPKSRKRSVGKYVMNLIEGGFRTITGLIAKSNPSDYKVNTPVATIGVRGTDYDVYFKKGEMYIGYYEGSPCVTGKKKAETLCLDESKKYAKVDTFTGVPVPVAIRPDVLGPKLEILPTKISPFTGGGGGQTTPSSTGGRITSFCIT